MINIVSIEARGYRVESGKRQRLYTGTKAAIGLGAVTSVANKFAQSTLVDPYARSGYGDHAVFYEHAPSAVLGLGVFGLTWGITRLVRAVRGIPSAVKNISIARSISSIILDISERVRGIYSPANTAQDPRLSEKKVECYQIIRIIGEGGMGRVLLARDTSLGARLCVLKEPLFPNKMNKEEIIARFIREASALAQLRSKHVMQVYRLAQDSQGNNYYVGEFVDGVPLSALVDQNNNPEKIVPVDVAAVIMQQIFEGLSDAHRKNIVHRDIKLGNIMINQDGNVVIIDFGLAKQVNKFEPAQADGVNILLPAGQDLTAVGGIMGTLPYLAPEAMSGAVMDHRGDMFACGVVFYTLLTGHLPNSFGKGAEAINKFKAFCESQGPTISEPENIPEAARDFILQLMARDPNNRFASYGELRTAFAEVLYKNKIIA